MKSLPFTFTEGLALWLKPIFHCFGKTYYLLVTRQRMRKRFRAQDLCSQVPAEWGAGEAGPRLMLMVTHILSFPICISSWQRQHLLPPAFFFLASYFGQQQEWQCHMSSAEIWQLNQDFLMQVSLSKLLRVETCICLACFFMVTSLCLDTVS